MAWGRTTHGSVTLPFFVYLRCIIIVILIFEDRLQTVKLQIIDKYPPLLNG